MGGKLGPQIFHIRQFCEDQDHHVVKKMVRAHVTRIVVYAKKKYVLIFALWGHSSLAACCVLYFSLIPQNQLPVDTFLLIFERCCVGRGKEHAMRRTYNAVLCSNKINITNWDNKTVCWAKGGVENYFIAPNEWGFTSSKLLGVEGRTVEREIRGWISPKTIEILCRQKLSRKMTIHRTHPIWSGSESNLSI